MARPQKTGLSYFTVDVDIFEDEKLQFISAKFGLKGEAIVFRLLSKIYRNGYYIEFDEDVQLLFSKSCGLERNDNATRNVVSELIKRKFFDKTTFEQFQVLTSKGIQRRYVKVCKDSGRDARNFLPKYDLLRQKIELSAEETLINYRENHIKKSKEEEIKQNQSKELNTENSDLIDIPSFVSENRKNVAPAMGGRPELTKEYLKEDFLKNRDIEKLYEENNIQDAYEKVIDVFLLKSFGAGKNENWKNIQDARSHLINSFKYYQNERHSYTSAPQQIRTYGSSPEGKRGTHLIPV